MSNLININVNKVENVVTKVVYYEIEAFDNYIHDSICIEEEQISKTDIDILQYLIDYSFYESGNIYDIVSSMHENQKGVSINNTYYEWEEIKHLFEENE